jgi:hypothetical protein
MTVSFKPKTATQDDAQRRDPPDERHVGVTPAPASSRGKPAAPKKPRRVVKTKAKAKPARKPRTPIYDKGVFDRVCAEVAKGRTLTEVLAADSTFMSRPAFYAAMKAHPLWAGDYEAAQECQRGVFADEILTLLDAVQQGDVSETRNGKTKASFMRDRIALAAKKADNRKWLLSKLDSRFREQTAATITHAGRMDVTKRVIVVTGGLPRKPLGELPPEERDAAVREAAKTREITWDQINNPFGLDIAAIEAQRARMTSEEEREFDAEPSLSPTDLAVLARVSGNPADYDGEA